MANPGQEISIRQIAAEAGVAHSDLYRYATSKDQLVDLAIARVEESIGTAIPADYDVLVGNLEALLERTRAATGPMRVLTDRALQGKLGTPNAPLPIHTIAEAIARHRADEGLSSSVDPRVLSACIASLTWGLHVLESRWLEAFDLDEIPTDQVATVMRAMLTVVRRWGTDPALTWWGAYPPSP